MGVLGPNIQNFRSPHGFTERLVPMKTPTKSVLMCAFHLTPPILRIIITLKDFWNRKYGQWYHGYPHYTLLPHFSNFIFCYLTFIFKWIKFGWAYMTNTCNNLTTIKSKPAWSYNYNGKSVKEGITLTESIIEGLVKFRSAKRRWGCIL